MDLHSQLLGKPSDLSENDCTKKADSLSDLTAKYNKSRSSSNLANVVGKNDYTDGTEKKLWKDKHPNMVSSKATLMSLDSSSDDSSDTEFNGFSLAGLVAKHRVSGVSCKVDSPVEISNMNKPLKLSSDSCSNSGDLLLHPSKSVQIQGNSQAAHGLLGTSSKETAQKEITTKANKEQKKPAPKEELTFAYVPDNFCDDSDSDESITLTKLSLRHSHSAVQVKTDSSNNLEQLKPKQLALIVNSNRQHTKSESDYFSSVTGVSSDNLKQSLKNEISASLRSLRENVQSESDFHFSMGCSLPDSYKPMSRSKNSLTSSVVNTSICFSDPDVSYSTGKTSNVRPSFNTAVISRSGIDLSMDVLDNAFEGINLSAAIKVSSSNKTSESTDVEGDLKSVEDSEEEVIVTLLDNLCVEEEHDTVPDKMISVQSTEQEHCTIDASNILGMDLKHHTNKCSLFGKVVCRKWRLIHMPYVRIEKLRTSLIPFDFSTLSPDDEVLSLLKRRH